MAKYTITCGGSFPSRRLARRPAVATASSTASRGTDEASTPSEIWSVSRPPATTTPLSAMRCDLAGHPIERRVMTRTDPDQLWLSGIDARPHRYGSAPSHETPSPGEIVGAHEALVRRPLRKARYCSGIGEPDDGGDGAGGCVPVRVEDS